MVKGLTVALRKSQSEVRPEITIQEMPRKEGNPRVILDGIALSYYVISPTRISQNIEQQGHRSDFINGGDYRIYSLRAIELFAVLKKFGIEVTLALPLADGTLPVSEFSNAKWAHKQSTKYQHIQTSINLIEKPGNHSFPDVLPNLLIDEIIDAANSQDIKIVTTRHNLTKFCATYMASGNADAVISQNTDFMIFKGVNYIPIDSIFINSEETLQISYYTNSIVLSLLGLPDTDKLFDLSFIIGNPHTEQILPQNQICELFNLKTITKPEIFVSTIVNWLNSAEYNGLTTTSPMAEYFIRNPNLKSTLSESKSFFDLSPLDEGDSTIRKLSEYSARFTQEKTALPNWALAISEGGDFWMDPILDDYSHDVKTERVTRELRKVFYGILGRSSVIEHLPDGTTSSVTVDPSIPKLEKVRKLKREALQSVWSSIVHDTFVNKPDASTDPLNSIDEPIKTAAFALRVIISQCFTDNQTAFSRLQSQNIRENISPSIAEALRTAGVIGAPPLDLFELRSICAMVIVLCSNAKFQIPSIKASKRRIKISALYQSTLQHLLWLQMLFGTSSERSKPHRLFDGELFGAMYDACGELENEHLLEYFSEGDRDKVRDCKGKVDAMVEAILAPFPKDLFEAFSIAPRNVSTSVYEQAKPPPSQVTAVKSAFSALMESSDDEDVQENIPEPEKTEVVEEEKKVEIALPPPPQTGKKAKKAKKEEDEEDEIAFLMAQAALNAQKGEQKVVEKTTKKPQKKYVRKGNQSRQGKQVFTNESKNELKRQLKQQAMGIYE